MQYVGARMKKARKEAMIRQKAAARAMGMDPTDLSKIENCRPGARALKASEIAKAAILYNRSADWLLGLSDRPYLRPDLAWRLAELPAELAARLIETPIYVIHEFLEIHGMLPHQLATKEKSQPP